MYTASYTFVVNKVEATSWLLHYKMSIAPKLLVFKKLKRKRLLEMLTEIDPNGVTYSLQLEFSEYSEYEEFNELHFPKINAEMQVLFKNQFAFFATLLKEI